MANVKFYEFINYIPGELDENIYSKNELLSLWKEFIEIKPEKSEKPKCNHVMTRGKNVGQKCSKPCAANSEYCSLHCKSKKDEKYLILKTHPSLKQLWNPSTCFVFDKEQRVVYKTTKIDSNKTCPKLPLTEKDIAKCREIGYKYIITPIKKKSTDKLEEKAPDNVITDVSEIKLVPDFLKDENSE